MESRRKADSWAVKAALLVFAPLLALAFMLAATETLIRLGLSPWQNEKYSVTSRERVLFDYGMGTAFAEHPFLPFALTPGNYNLGEKKQLTINSLGYRGPEFTREKPPGTFRILFVGDSYIFGYGLDDNDVAARKLEEKLRARLASAKNGGSRKIEVINAGFHGSSPAQYELYLRKEGYDLAPDLILLAVLSDNDFTDVSYNEVVKRDAEGKPAVIRDGLVAYKGRRYYQDVPPALVTLPVLRHSIAWFHFVKLVSNALRAPPALPSRAEAEAFVREPLAQIVAETEARKIPLRIFLLTGGEVIAKTPWAVEFYARLQRLMAEARIPYWDFGDAVLAREPGFFTLKFRNEVGEYTDGHYNAAGNEFLAELLAAKIAPLVK